MIRRIGRASLWVLGVSTLVAVTAFGLVQTGTGKRLLAAGLGRTLTTAGAEVELSGLAGLVPFDMTLARVQLRDPQGIWLDAREVRLAWAPRALLAGRISVEHATIEQLDLSRLPDDGADEPLTLPTWPELPRALPLVTIDHFEITDLALGEAVLGEPAHVAIVGQAAAVDQGRALSLALQARRTDQATAQAELSARIGLDPPSLTIEGRGSETGGLLAALSGRPAAGDLHLELAGDGPIDGWSGRLAIQADGLATVEATLALTTLEPLDLRLQARLVPGDHLLAGDLAGLLGAEATLGLRASDAGDQTLAVRDLVAETALGRVTGTADLGLAAGTVAAELTLALPDLAPLGPLTGLGLAGDVTATALIQGSLDRLTADLGLSGQGLVVDTLALDQLEADLGITTRGRLGTDDVAVQVTGDGQLRRVELRGGPLSLDALVWRLQGTVPAVGPVMVDAFQASATPLGITATAAGRIDPANLEASADLIVEAADLGALTTPFGLGLDGRARVHGVLRAPAGGVPMVIDLDGELADLEGLPPGVVELLGQAPGFGAHLALAPGERLEISDLTVAGEAASLGGHLALGLAGDDLGGTIELDVPSLAPLAEPLGQDLVGSAHLVADLAGTLDDPAIELRAQGERLRLSGWPVDELQVTAAARDLLAAPGGELGATMRTRGVALGLETDWRLAGAQLDLSDLALTLPGGRLDGRLAVDLAGPTVAGQLGGALDDLADLGALLPIALGGRLTVDADLDDAAGDQRLGLTLAGEDLRGPFGRLARLRLDASGRDLLDQPTLDATLVIEEYRQGAVQLERAELQASGPWDALDLRASVAGEVVEPVALAASGGLTIGQDVRLRLDEVDGEAAGVPLRLAGPAELTVAGERLGVAGLDLRLGEARLRADGSLARDAVDARVTLDQLSLAALEPLGAPALEGHASASLTLAGRPANPDGKLVIEVDDLRPPAARFRDLPPATIRIDADLAGRRLDLELRAEGATAEPVVLVASAPLTLDLDRLTVDVPADGALDGRLDAQIQLARVADALALDDQRLDGLLTIRLEADGTIAAPLIGGPIELRDGRVELGETGTVLDQVTLRAEARGREIVIEELSATDGASGRLTGRGRVLIDPANDFPIDVALELSRARLIQSDFLSATLSGDLAFTGDVDGTRLSGTITVDRADASLPEGGGPDITVIDVETLGEDGPSVGAAEAGTPAPLALDLTIAMPGQVFVGGRGLRSEWRGELRVTGPADAPVLNGTLTVKQGELLLLDRRLDLRRGEILFSGASPPVPEFDIEAATQTADITAVIRLLGTPDDPRLELDSEPSLPDEEVLSYLLFGEPTEQITAGQAVQLAAAVGRLAGGDASIYERFRAGLGVDVLDIGVGATPDQNKVRAGKRVTDQVYIEVEQGEAERSGRARVEVEILPGVSVEADSGEDEKTGMGVRWRFDY